MNLLQSINHDLIQKEELDQLEEAGRFKRAVGKAASAIGMKGKGANLQAQGDSAQKIKEMQIAFQKFAGQMGKNMKTATVDDLRSFFKSQNRPISNALSTAKRGANLQSIPTTELKKAFQIAIQGGVKRDMRQQGAQPAQQEPQQTSQQQPAQPQQQGKQQAVQQTPNGRVAGKLQQAISTLSPSQANSLISALQAV